MLKISCFEIWLPRKGATHVKEGMGLETDVYILCVCVRERLEQRKHEMCVVLLLYYGILTPIQGFEKPSGGEAHRTLE